jgi:hypothetical protein
MQTGPPDTGQEPANHTNLRHHMPCNPHIHQVGRQFWVHIFLDTWLEDLDEEGKSPMMLLGMEHL